MLEIKYKSNSSIKEKVIMKARKYSEVKSMKIVQTCWKLERQYRKEKVFKYLY